MIDPFRFLRAVRRPAEIAPTFRLATVAAYSGTNGTTVTFDGESAADPTYYRRGLSSSLTAGDRVLLARVGNTYVVIDKIGI